MKQSKVKAVSKVNTAQKEKPATIPAEKPKPIAESPQDEDEIERTTIAGKTRDGCSYKIRPYTIGCFYDEAPSFKLTRVISYELFLSDQNGNNFEKEGWFRIWEGEFDHIVHEKELIEIAIKCLEIKLKGKVTSVSEFLKLSVSELAKYRSKGELKIHGKVISASELNIPYSEILRKALILKGWENVEDFVYRGAFPDIYSRKKYLSKSSNAKFYNEYVRPLKSDIGMNIDLSDLYPPYHWGGLWSWEGNLAIKKILTFIDKEDVEKSKKFMTKFIKFWHGKEYRESPESKIYGIVFPRGYIREQNFPLFDKKSVSSPPIFLDPPIPMTISEIVFELSKKECPMSYQHVSRICKAMHIGKLSEAGRPRKI